MERRSSAALFTVLFFGIALLYLPILVLIGYSFNASPLVNVWGGFSTAWYARLLHNRPLLEAALLSLEVAVAASSGAVVLGTLAAVALVRFARFPGRLLLTGMVNAPLVMPEIITGITQLLLFVSMVQLFSWPHRGFTTIVLSHITFCTAYVTITVQSRLAAADRTLEEAAQDLGASPARAFLEITLPIIAPAIISSWLLCFTLSLDDLVISSFVAGPGASTLPMVIYSKVKLGVSPDINALASLIVCAVGVCIIAAGWLVTRSDRRRALETQHAVAEHAAGRAPRSLTAPS
jgi:putrescine transport system permease protein